MTARAHAYPADPIQAAVIETSLGPLLVAATAEGVVFTAFGESAEELRGELAHRFPDARIADADERTRAWAAAVAEMVEGGSAAAVASAKEVPVVLEGTPFQRAVWDELRAIPRGETITYAELARRIGNPKAVRAVAQACGANPVGVLVPCHRVIGTDGSLTGFASGVDRKRALLEREGAL